MIFTECQGECSYPNPSWWMDDTSDHPQLNLFLQEEKAFIREARNFLPMVAMAGQVGFVALHRTISDKYHRWVAEKMASQKDTSGDDLLAELSQRVAKMNPQAVPFSADSASHPDEQENQASVADVAPDNSGLPAGLDELISLLRGGQPMNAKTMPEGLKSKLPEHIQKIIDDSGDDVGVFFI
jgi:hypothetical protein